MCVCMGGAVGVAVRIIMAAPGHSYLSGAVTAGETWWTHKDDVSSIRESLHAATTILGDFRPTEAVRKSGPDDG